MDGLESGVELFSIMRIEGHQENGQKKKIWRKILQSRKHSPHQLNKIKQKTLSKNWAN